jgi:hypothetical protein
MRRQRTGPHRTPAGGAHERGPGSRLALLCIAANLFAGRLAAEETAAAAPATTAAPSASKIAGAVDESNGSAWAT